MMSNHALGMSCARKRVSRVCIYARRVYDIPMTAGRRIMLQGLGIRVKLNKRSSRERGGKKGARN